MTHLPGLADEANFLAESPPTMPITRRMTQLTCPSFQGGSQRQGCSHLATHPRTLAPQPLRPHQQPLRLPHMALGSYPFLCQILAEAGQEQKGALLLAP